ncbi:MAG: hypothetical protein ACR2LM_05625 [Pyrinomonadaceae bacterium]
MFCPRCGANQNEDLKFCNLCGANLQAVREVVDTKETTKKFEWSDTWVAEMFFSADEKKRRKLEQERLRGLTPEVKRYNEIKAGVITVSVGISLMLLLSVLMEGLIIGGKLPNDAIEILSRIWIVGVLPVLVGIALIINGVFVSKKIVEAEKRNVLPERETSSNLLRSADTTEFVARPFSVTEETTKHLRGSKPS